MTTSPHPTPHPTYPHPHQYPVLSERRHGPSKYAEYGDYRPWLRDEFEFRCAYCLVRENWCRGRRIFELDHQASQVSLPELSLVYENLAYSCRDCNGIKNASNFTQIPTDQDLVINEDGTIASTSSLGKIAIGLFYLDGQEITDFRAFIIRSLRNSILCNDVSNIKQLLGYPKKLPNLGRLRPPQNSKPDGILQSAYERRKRNELPDYY